MNPMRTSSAIGAVAGLAGGLAASFVMNQVMAHLSGTHRGTDPQRSKQFLAARKKRSQAADPTGRAAEVVARNLLGRPLTQREREISGPLVHYIFGAVAGAAYGVTAEAQPKMTIGRGVPYGIAIWLFGDEIAVPALGLKPNSTEASLEAHGAMFASHVVYGLTLETMRRTVRKLAA